jgi:choline dehydrogenase-like flavoprotein
MIARALGGCGIHNAMLYVRALEEDFQVGWLVVQAHSTPA